MLAGQNPEVPHTKEKETDNIIVDEQHRKLIHACIDGDIEALINNFGGIDVRESYIRPHLAALLSTCVFYSHPALFEYIYTQMEKECCMAQQFARPFVLLRQSELIIPVGPPMTSMLSVAYRSNDLEFFKLLLTKYRYDPNCSFRKVDSLIVEMARAPGEIKYLKLLLRAGANTNNLNPNSYEISDQALATKTPLREAVRTGNIAAVKLLLEFKADPLAHTSPDGETPVAVAIKLGKPAILRELLRKIPREQLQNTYTEYSEATTFYSEKFSPEKLAIIKQINDTLKNAHLVACKIDADKFHKENKLNDAEKLYLEAVSIDDKEVRHVVHYDLGTCYEKMGKKEEAKLELAKCMNIRNILARDPVKREGLKPLIEEAKEKLADLSNGAPKNTHASSLR